MATNPLILQGTLNRVRCSIALASLPALNITSSYMTERFADLDLPGEFSALIPTGTGAVTSPEPYIIGTISVGLLRTQSLAAAWLAQAQILADIGNVTVHSDAAPFPRATLGNCVFGLNPGAFDGKSPEVRITIRGVYYVNNELWNMT